MIKQPPFVAVSHKYYEGKERCSKCGRRTETAKKHPTPEKVEAIKDALKYFEVI